MKQILDHIDIILPIILLVLAFILKLSIDRTIQAPNLIQAICELPVDMVFLALSFLIAFTIAPSQKEKSEGLLWCFGFVIVAIFIVILWRRSLALFDRKNLWWIGILLLNFLIATLSVYQATNVLLNKDTVENNQCKTEEHGDK